MLCPRTAPDDMTLTVYYFVRNPFEPYVSIQCWVLAVDPARLYRPSLVQVD